MKRDTWHVAFWLVAMLPVTNVCTAQDSGWYVGIGAGKTTADFARPKVAYLDYEPFTIRTGPSGPEFNVTAELVGVTEDKTATNYEILLGYRLNRYWAIETAYNEIGSVGAELHSDEVLTSPLTPDALTRERRVTASRESTGVTFTLLGALPLSGKFSLLGVVGAMYSDSVMEERTLTVHSNGGTSSPESRFEEQNTSVFAGVGFDMSVSARVRLRLLYRYFPDVNAQVYGSRDRSNDLVKNGDFDLQQAGINLLYSF